MNDVINFNYDGTPIRSVYQDGEIWWVLKDVCAVLEIAKHRDVASRLDEDERGSVKVDTPSGVQNMLAVNESGLYNVIIRSDKPKAKPFRKWLTNEVIPSIRKTGGYVGDSELFVSTYLPYADEQTKELFRLHLSTIKQLNAKIEADKPKVDFADCVADTTDLIDVGELSKLFQDKGFKIGRNRLFKWLRNNKYLMSNNEPYQQYMNSGYFATKEYTYLVGDEPKVGIKTYVTGKGQQYLFKKLTGSVM